ncbi:MAG: hypothetical protein JWO42_1595 [Chloroflexi bacterium]|nr:hypothetical protein [Chloroflexota bacterium]
MRLRSQLKTFAVLGVFSLICSVVGNWQPARAADASKATFVFFEKFPSDNPREWNVQSLSDGSKTFLQGSSYHIVRTRPGTMRGWPLQVKVPSGFQFNAKFQLVKGSDPYEGISFWDDLANSFTLFAVTPDGNAGLFRHDSKGYKVLVDWRPVASIHRGVGAVNSLSVNLDRYNAAAGRSFLINGVPLGRACNDTWQKALGTPPTSPARGLFVGLVAGTYKGSSQVMITRASMYDGTQVGPVPACPSGAKKK